MAKNINRGSEATNGASVVVERDQEITADAPAVIYFNKGWKTPDGRWFNTRLKAERHLKSAKA
jgi:hypothetical protein